MIAAVWEEADDATQTHRSAAQVAVGDSRFPRTGGKDWRLKEEVTRETLCSWSSGFNEVSSFKALDLIEILSCWCESYCPFWN